MLWRDLHWGGRAITSASQPVFRFHQIHQIVDSIGKTSSFHNQEEGFWLKKCQKPRTDLREHIEYDVPPHPEEKLPRGPRLVRVDEGVKLEVHVVHIL